MLFSVNVIVSMSRTDKSAHSRLLSVSQ